MIVILILYEYIQWQCGAALWDKETAGTGGAIVCYACFAGRRRRESRVAVKEVVRSLTMEIK